MTASRFDLLAPVSEEQPDDSMAARGGVDIKLVQRQLQLLGHDLDEAAIAAFVEKMNLDSQPVAEDGGCQQVHFPGAPDRRGDLSDNSLAPAEDTPRPQHQKIHKQGSSGSSGSQPTAHAGHKTLDQRCRRFLGQMPARPAASKALAASSQQDDVAGRVQQQQKQQQQHRDRLRAAGVLPCQLSSSASDVSDCSDSDDQEASCAGGDSDDCVLFEPTRSAQQALAAAAGADSCGADRCAAAASALPRFGFRPGYQPVGIHIPPPAAGCMSATINVPAPQLRTDALGGLRGSARVQELQQQLAALRAPKASVEPPAATAASCEPPRPPATRQPTSTMQLAGDRGSMRRAAALARNSSSSTSKASHSGSLSVSTSMARGSMLPPPPALVASSSSSRSIGIGSSKSSSSRAAGRSCGAAHGSLAQYSARLSSGGLRSKAVAPGVRPTDRVARFHQMRRLWEQDRFLMAGAAKGLSRTGGTFVETAEGWWP